jgi:hypothetical protein
MGIKTRISSSRLRAPIDRLSVRVMVGRARGLRLAAALAESVWVYEPNKCQPQRQNNNCAHQYHRDASPLNCAVEKRRAAMWREHEAVATSVPT